MSEKTFDSMSRIDSLQGLRAIAFFWDFCAPYKYSFKD